jgi:hypothetical protein
VSRHACSTEVPGGGGESLTGGSSTTWIIVGAVAGAVAACLAFECFEGDDDDAVPN